MLPLLVTMLTVIVLIFLPSSQYLSHCLLLVGVTVWVSQYEVIYGLGVTFP